MQCIPGLSPAKAYRKDIEKASQRSTKTCKLQTTRPASDAGSTRAGATTQKQSKLSKTNWQMMSLNSTTTNSSRVKCSRRGGRACSMRHACLVVCQRLKNDRDAEKRRVLNDQRPTSDRTICPDAHVPQHSMSPGRGAQPQSWLVCKLTLCSPCAMRWTTKMCHDVGIVDSVVSACCR